MKKTVFLCVITILGFAHVAGQGVNVEKSHDSFTIIDTNIMQVPDTIPINSESRNGFMISTLKELRKEIPILVEDIEKRKKELLTNPDDIHLADFIKAQETILQIMQTKLRLFSQLKGLDLNGKKIKHEQEETEN